MKRFYKEARCGAVAGGWQVMLDGRGVKTQGGQPQIVPSETMAKALAAEWAAQSDPINPTLFILRDLADYALDVIAPDPTTAIAALLPYGETDTLCYRDDAGTALHRRQDALWEPLLMAAEQRWDIAFVRVSGVIHQAQPAATMARLQVVLAAQDAFALAALRSMAGLAASLMIALLAAEGIYPADKLWQAASLEEDYQAELWGQDAEAEARQTKRYADFAAAQKFSTLRP